MPPRPHTSVIIGTARSSFASLVADHREHLFQRTFASLALQTDQNFEVIIVDSLSFTRDLAAEIAQLGPWSFPYRVIANDSWWLTLGFWALQRAFNLGAMASRGDYLLFCGDCFAFPPDAFARSRILLDQGKHPHFLCWKRVGGLLEDPKAEPPAPAVYNNQSFTTVEELDAAGHYQPGAIHGDTRFADPMMQANGCILPEHASWQWFYGYGYIPRTDFFSVNGWSELYDGDKALGDVELGSRLEMCGRLHLYMERTLVVYEECHEAIILARYEHAIQNSVRSNYDLIWLHRVHSITRAHSVRLSSTDLWRCVRATLTGLHGWPYRYEISHELRNLTERWIASQPIYQLDDHVAGST